MSNTTFGTNNIILPVVTNSLAAGEGNTIEKGNAHICLGQSNQIKDGISNICLGSRHTIDVTTTPFSGFENQCNGRANSIYSINNNPTSLGNQVGGIGNTILDGQAMNMNGFRNTTTKGAQSNIEGNTNRLNSGILVHMEGFFNTVEGNPQNLITEDISIIHVEGFGNKVIFVGDGRSGVNMTGRRGYFLFDKNKPNAEDTYNYSNQLAGGGGPEQSLYHGEGISMIDRTIINGIYPIGKHQSYLNTSDGMNYSMMMKGEEGLKNGTFITLHNKKCNKCDKYCHKTSNERILAVAKNNDEVIGVISESSGFIANAGQFPASERIEYDEYHKPIIKLNTLTQNPQVQNFIEMEEEFNISQKESNISQETILSPAFLTVPLENIDRSKFFIPFNERPNYYQVALLGSVIVNAKFKKRDRYHLKCDVKNGVAVPGTKYWIIKFIDKYHLEILLK
jgi:hypothetical protein